MRPLLLDVGGRDNLGGEVEPLPEVVETLGGEGVVVVLPRELGLDVAARGQGLAGLDDEEVADAGLVGRLIAAAGNELASAGRCRARDVAVGGFEDGFGSGGSRFVAGMQHLRSLDGIGRRGDIFLGKSGETYFLAATMTPSRKRYCLEC